AVAGGYGNLSKVELNLADAVSAVGAGNIDAVAARRGRRSADKMIAFVGSEDEERVRFVDAGGFQVGEKSAEGGVVIGKLLDVSGFAGPEGVGGAERCALLVIVGVGNVGKDHRDALLEHGFDDGKGLRGRGIEVELAEAGQRNAVVVGEAAQSRS